MPKDERGFTLIELMIAILLVSVLVLAVTGLLGMLPRFYQDLRAQEETQDNIWTAINFMAQELRSARGFHISSSVSELIFLDEGDQQIRYFLAGNVLQRQIGIASPAPMVDNVTDWEIVYSVTDLADLSRFSRITLKLNGEAITVRPRIYRGEDAADGGWCE